jgi:nascent polypeptide-associated complex subunit alpha
MLPNINARQMQQAMKRMGIQQEEIDAIEVIIRCPDKNIIIKDPSVQKVNMMGQKSYQISGKEIEESEQDDDIVISDDDISTVAEQAGVSGEDARKALEESKGDIAEAILKLKGE